MTLQIIAWASLLLFGFLYNAHVGSQIHQRRHDFMARFVMLGVFVFITVQTAATGHWVDGALYLIAASCAGAGMAWGSWQRRKLLDAEPLVKGQRAPQHYQKQQASVTSRGFRYP